MLNTILSSDWKGHNAIVIRAQNDKPLNEPRRFMTHHEQRNPNRPSDTTFYTSGHYDLTLSEALADFESRCAEWGNTYDSGKRNEVPFHPCPNCKKDRECEVSTVPGKDQHWLNCLDCGYILAGTGTRNHNGDLVLLTSDGEPLTETWR